MDNQPIEQMNTNIPNENAVEQVATVQNGSEKIWIIVIAIIVVALASWYFYPRQMISTDTQPSTQEQTQIPELSSGDTITDIANDLSQVPDMSAALNQDTAASAEEVQGF